MKHLLLVVGTIVVLLGVPVLHAVAVEYDPVLDEMSDQEILRLSRATPSSDERARLRGYLAEYRPDTVAGLIGRAWIATAETDYLEAERLYLEALDRDRDNALALNNIAFIYQVTRDYELQAEYYTRLIRVQRSMTERDGIQPHQDASIQYFTYLDRIGSERRAAQYRSRLERELGADHFVFANIDAVLARRDGDYERAYRLREEAIRAGDPPYWFREEHAELQYRYLTGDTQDAGRRLAPFYQLVTWARANTTPQNQYRAMAQLANALDEDFGAHRDAFDLYQQAFEVYPAPEALRNTFDSARSRWPAETVAFLESVRERLPYSPEALRVEAWNYRDFQLDSKRAVAAAERAPAVSATPAQRRDSAQELGRVLQYTQQDFDRAYRVVADEDAFATAEADRQTWLYQNRLIAGDFARALEHLERRRSLGDLNLTWYEERRLRLERMQRALAEEAQQIVFGGSYDADAIAVSPDGRLAAVGYYPMQLRDLQQDVKIRDLGRGGSTRAFSPDGRFVATLSNYTIESGTEEKALYVYRVEDGKLLFIAPVIRQGSLSGLAWSPDSTRVVFGDGIGSMHVYEVPSGTPVGIFRTTDVRIASRVTWLPNANIAVASAQDDRLRLVNDTTFAPARELTGVSWPHTIGHTRDGRYLVSSDNRYVLHVWDTRSWQRRSMRIPMFARGISVHESEPMVVLIDAASNRVRAATYDVEHMEELAQLQEGDRYKPAFAGDELLLGDDETILRLNPRTMEVSGSYTSRAATGTQMLLDDARGFAVVRDGEGAHFFHVERGEFVRTLPDMGTVFDLGSGRFASFTDGTGTVYSTRRLSAERQFSVGVRVDRLSRAGGVVAVAGPPLAGDYDRAETARIEVYETGTYRLLYALEAPFATEYVPQAVYNARVTGLAVSDDGRNVSLLTQWRDGFGRAVVDTKEARVFDPSGAVVSRIRYNDRDASSVAFAADDQDEIIVGFDGFRRRYHVSTGRYVDFAGYSLGSTERLENGETLTWTSSHISVGDRMVFLPSFIVDVAVDERRGLLLAYTRQNQLLVYRLSTLEVITFTVRVDGEWLTWTPRGFFTGPSASAQRLAYLVAADTTIVDMDQFFSLFFRPDVVEAVLAGVPIDDDVGDLSIQTALVVLPEVQIYTEAPQRGVMRVRVEAQNRGGGAEDIRLFHNGVRVSADTRGLSVVSQGDGQAGRTAEAGVSSAAFVIQLADGENHLRAVAYTRNQVESEAAERTISYQAPDLQRPSLWLLAVGINEYRNPRYNLNYAVGDAQAVAEAVERAGAGLYDRVHVTMIQNRDASREAIVSQISSIAARAKPDDVFMFFYAGHGIALDPDQDGASDFYFIPSDVTQMTDPSQIERAALSGPEFQELAAGVPARKQFFVLDACNSGAMSTAFGIRGAAEELALSRLGRATGSALIAASRDDQFAQEFTALGQGALTKAVLDGLSGSAATGSGEITVGTLKTYVEFTLPELTEQYAGRPQFPTGFIFGQDFSIGVR